MKHVTASLTVASCLLLAAAGTVFATPQGPGGTPQQNPTGAPGQKGAPTNTCPGTSGAPGAAGAASNPGSPFNGSPTTPGQAGNVYAGNPGTASLANSNSGAAVAQYDVACFRVIH
jgi:hypothetical protein